MHARQFRLPTDFISRAGAVIALSWAATFGAAAAEERLPPDVAASLKSAGIPLSAVSIVVQEPGVARPSLSVNGSKALNPASTMKLVTTYAALELLGPNFQWKTEALANGSMTGDVLDGDLVLKGGGDPKLTIENLWLLVRALRARGLREIRGDLLLDRSYFEAIDADPSRFDAEPLRPYNVTPDALLVNFKAVRFTFSPSLERAIAQVIPEPKPLQMELSQSVRLVDGPCNDWRSRLKADIQSTAINARVAFSGQYPASCGERTWNIALLGHTAYIHGAFRQLWEESGGTIRGTVRDGMTPSGARSLYALESSSLAEIVRDINKYSNNVMARQLFLTLSSEIQKTPGNNTRSAEVVKGWLAQKRIDAPELVLENGSGLSRQERISADNLARVLDAAFRSSVMPELMASLPLVASDGTMRRRLKYDSIAGQAHIKTGSLSDVRAIAGFVLDRLGRRQIVVFLINHPNAVAGQSAQDAMLRRVYDRN